MHVTSVTYQFNLLHARVKIILNWYLHYASVESKDLDQHAQMRRVVNVMLSHLLSGLMSCEGMFLFMSYVV